MPASDEFKKALRSGDLPEAFVMAMGRATELNITTKVVKADGTISETYNPAQQLHTRLDLLNGTIDNEIGEDFVGDNSKYREIQQFHQQQVALGNLKIQENFQSLQQLFRLLVTLQQYNRINNAEEPLDLTFLEVPSHALPAERVISSLREQEESILETVAGISIPSPTGEVASEPIASPEPSVVEVEPAAESGFSPEGVEPNAPVETAKRVAIAPPIPPLPRRSPPQRDDEPLSFLDSFAALDLDEAPEPEMPLSEVEVDDWETPVEFSPAERLAQNAGEAYVPSLDDFDQDDIGDLLGDDDLDNVFEDSDVSDSDMESVASILVDADEDTEIRSMSAPMVADMEGIESSFDASLFDEELADEVIGLAPGLATADGEMDSSSVVVEDALDSGADDLDGLLDDDSEVFFDGSDLEATDATTVIEDKELTFDAAALEELAEDADVVAETNLNIDTDFDASAAAAMEDGAIADDGDDFLDDLLGEEEITEISVGQASEPTVQADDFLEAEPDAPDLAVPEESIPEAIAPTTTALMAEEPAVAQTIDSNTGIEPQTIPSAEDLLPDDELLQFLGQDWQSHPGVSEITSLDDELESELESNSGEPAVLQPLSEEELADLEDVEDTDWLASSLDNDWTPLNTGDTGASLSGIDLSPDLVEDHGEIDGAGQLELLEDELTPAEATAPVDDADSFEDESLDMAAIADASLDPLETMDFSTGDDIDADGALADASDETSGGLEGLDDDDGEAIAAVEPEQPDFSILPDPFAEKLDGWLDPDNDAREEEVDLAPNPEASMPIAEDLDEAGSPDRADSDDDDVFLDPFADWSEDDDPLSDLGELDLPDLNDAGVNFADGEMPADMPLESLDTAGEDGTFSDPLVDLDEDDDDVLGELGDLDVGNLGDVAGSDIPMDTEDGDLDDPFAGLAVDDSGLGGLGDLDVGNLGAGVNDFIDGDFSVDAEDEETSNPLADLGDDDALGELGDLDLSDLGDIDNDLAGDMSMAEMSLDTTGTDELGDDDFAVDPFANLDDVDLGEGDDPLGDLGDLDLSDLDDMAADDLLTDTDGDDLSMGSLEFPDLGDADGDEGFLSTAVLDSIKALDASTAELNLPNTEGNSVPGLMADLATSDESNVDDTDLLAFTDTDDELDLESLALESELELADLGNLDDADGGLDGSLAFDDLAIADDSNPDGSWNDLDLGDSDQEEPLPAISLGTDTDGDWQDLELPATEESAADNTDWDALQNTTKNDAKSTAGDGLDNWAIADLERLNDLGDADLGELGNFDLDSLEVDDSTEDFDLFGSDDDTDPFNLLFESET